MNNKTKMAWPSIPTIARNCPGRNSLKSVRRGLNELVSLGVLIVVVVPEVASQSAKLLGVGRGADLVVYISLFILFFTVFRLVVALERAKRDITTLTRELALKNSDTKV
jgi:hypothetical protein